jgi:hypothetical protein
MPFFDNDNWLSSVSRMWLWFAFTVPITSVTFLFYGCYKRRGEKELSEEEGEVEKEENGDVGNL